MCTQKRHYSHYMQQLIKTKTKTKVTLYSPVQVLDYLHCDWRGWLDLTDDLEEFKAVTMEPDSNVEGKQLSLSFHVKRGAALDLYAYAPYWIINKTRLPVEIRVSDANISKFDIVNCLRKCALFILLSHLYNLCSNLSYFTHRELRLSSTHLGFEPNTSDAPAHRAAWVSLNMYSYYVRC